MNTLVFQLVAWAAGLVFLGSSLVWVRGFDRGTKRRIWFVVWSLLVIVVIVILVNATPEQIYSTIGFLTVVFYLQDGLGLSKNRSKKNKPTTTAASSDTK